MPKLKRKRQIRTCEYCYHHKLKCDRTSPCSTCLRTKSDCVYQFQNIKKDCGISNELVKDETEDTVNLSNKSIKIIKTVNENKPKVKFTSGANDTPLYYSRAFYPYLEPSLNRMLLFKMTDIDEYESQTDDPMDRLNDGYLNYTRDELIDEYPKKEEFDSVIHLYWEYVHPLVPVLDKEITISQYQKFWEGLGNSISPQFDVDYGILFLAMLYSIKKAFEVNEKDPKKLENLKKQKVKVYNTFQKYKLAFKLISHASLAYIQATIILFQCGFIHYVGLFPYTATIARQAEYMGLHRDPILHDVYPKTIHIKDAEMRRRSWNLIRFLDTATSFTAGMSPHMIMTNSSTKFPSKRDYNHETQQYDGEMNPFMIFHITRFKCSLVMETISHYLNSDFSSDQEKIIRWEGISRTATALYQDLNILVKEIFSCSSNSKYSYALLRWLVSNTSIMVHRTYLLLLACDRRPYSHQNRVILKPLNQPDIGFRRLSQAKTHKEFFEQILTIRMPYLETAIEVCTLLLYETKIRCGLSSELNKFRWFAGASNPFQYIFFVLRDIYHYPTKIYDFSHLPPEIRKFIFDEKILNCKEEVRKYAVDESITALYKFEDQWPSRLRDIMDFLVELRKFVYRSVEQNTNNFSKTNCEAEDFNSIKSTFGMEKYRSIFNIISSMDEESSSYSIKSENSNFEQNKTDSNNASSREISMGGTNSLYLNNEQIEAFQKANSPGNDNYIPFRNSPLQQQPISYNFSPDENQPSSSSVLSSYKHPNIPIASPTGNLPLVQKMQNKMGSLLPMIPNQEMLYGSQIPSLYSGQSPQSLPLLQPTNYVQPVMTIPPNNMQSINENNHMHSNIVIESNSSKIDTNKLYDPAVLNYTSSFSNIRYRSSNTLDGIHNTAPHNPTCE